jgi:hypothetical protein
VAYEVLVPVPQFCQDDGSTLVCKFTPPELDFGEKRRKAERRPWATIPWKGRKFFHVTAEGDGILR